MSKFTEEFSRMEVNWFYRHLMSENEKTMQKIQTMKGAEKVLTNQQHDELIKLGTFSHELARFITLLSDVRANADKHKHALLMQKEMIEEAIQLIPSFPSYEDEDEEVASPRSKSPEEIAADRQRLDAAADLMEINMALEKAERIKLTLDRPVIKFIFKLIERDLHKFRTSIIPKYEKASPDDFKDSPSYMGKDYWIAKSTKAKVTLEEFKRKLEKGL